MKLAVAATVSIVNASLQASFEKISQLNNTNFPDLRAFQGTIKSLFEPINGYGCWCHLDASWRSEARGETVDPIDEVCKRLINSYRCIEMDAQEQGIDCDAQSVEYT